MTVAVCCGQTDGERAGVTRHAAAVRERLHGLHNEVRLRLPELSYESDYAEGEKLGERQ